MNAPSVQFSIPMKSTGVAYLLWLFFGGFGAHKFYLGRPGVAVLYIFMLVLFWLGLLSLSAVAVEHMFDAITLTMEQGKHPSPVRPESKLGGLGVTGIAMIAPLPIAFLYDLFTIPSQVRAANNRLISESSNYFGSGSKSGAAFDNDELDSEKLAQIDQTIARYKAQQSTAVSTPGRTPAPTSGAPTFGKRR